MLRPVIKLGVILAVLVGVGYPVSQEFLARAAIRNGMINSLDANDAAALREWPGSAESFIAMLHDRCMRAHAGDAGACTRYQSN